MLRFERLETLWLQLIAGQRWILLTVPAVAGIVWMSPALGVATGVIVLHIAARGRSARGERLEMAGAIRQNLEVALEFGPLVRSEHAELSGRLDVVHATLDGIVTAQARLEARLDETITGILEGFHQTESLDALYRMLQPPTPIPPTRSWVMSPDLLRHLAQTVRSYEPQTVIEAGSGVSTAVIALALKRAGSGRIIALEHLEWAKESTDRLLHDWGVTEHGEVRLAPLEDYVVDGETFQWYALAAVPGGEFDFILIDGPPGSTNHLARYPAGRVLLQRMSVSGRAVLDDTNRKDELEVVKRWQREIEGLAMTRLKMEKGAIELKWKSAPEKPSAE